MRIILITAFLSESFVAPPGEFEQPLAIADGDLETQTVKRHRSITKLRIATHGKTPKCESCKSGSYNYLALTLLTARTVDEVDCCRNGEDEEFKQDYRGALVWYKNKDAAILRREKSNKSTHAAKPDEDSTVPQPPGQVKTGASNLVEPYSKAIFQVRLQKQGPSALFQGSNDSKETNQ